jgi:hypothetical protein
MHPELSASKVAGLVGLHKYQSFTELAYELLLKDPVGKAKIAEIERAENRRPFHQLVQDVLQDGPIRDIIAGGIREAQQTRNVQGVLGEVAAQADLVLQMRQGGFPADIRARLVDEVRGKVSKQRGLNNENTILDQYEVRRDVKVTERNTKTIKKDFGSFVLVGRCDGYVAAERRIVDSKDRTRVWPTVPIYDEIQLRCYMKLYDAAEAELIERFPNGTTRHTKYLADDGIWAGLEDSLRRAVERLSMVLEDTEELKRIVHANTVVLASHGSQAPPPSPAILDG